MSEMVERVARAIFLDPEFTGDPPAPACEWDEIDERICKALARAAIAAMREPNEAMLKAADESYPPHVGTCPDCTVVIWGAMIDAALSMAARRHASTSY